MSHYEILLTYDLNIKYITNKKNMNNYNKKIDNCICIKNVIQKKNSGDFKEKVGIIIVYL